MTDDERLFEQTIWGQPIEEAYDPATVKAGTFDMRLLEQTTYWVDGNGGCHLLSEMAPRWRLNIAAFLFVKCRSMHSVESLYEATGAGASAAQYLTMLASGAPAVAEIDPYDWLVATPFFIALRALQPDLAGNDELRTWAEDAHARWAIDPDAAVMLPQDPDRVWNA